MAAGAGALFGKAHALSEEVYLAMVARGYTGNARSLAQRKATGPADAAWVVLCLLLAAAVLGADHALG